MHRLYHDFNKLWPGTTGHLRCAPLVCRGTHEDLQRQSLTLSEGMKVVLYMPDYDDAGQPGALEVKAIIRRDQKEGCFVADFIWDELKFIRGDSPNKDA